MKRVILGLVLLGSSIATTAVADYICYTRLTPSTASKGDFGYVRVTRYTGPDCSGSFVATDYLCSDGATSSTCANANYHYSETGLHAVFEATRSAAQLDSTVTRVSATCMSGGGSCTYGYYFY